MANKIEFNRLGNVVLLITTLRIVGSAFEIYDLEKMLKLEHRLTYWRYQRYGIDHIWSTNEFISDKDFLKFNNHFVPANFSVLLCYTFSLIGLYSGPYYTLRCFLHMINRKNFKNFYVKATILAGIKKLALVLPLFVIFDSKFNPKVSNSVNKKYETTDEFLSSTLLSKYVYIFGVFAALRLKFYFAWILSDISCVCSSLGGYPVSSLPKPGFGPTKFDFEDTEDHNFETTSNIDIYNCELSPTLGGAIKSWNKGVQYWLVFTVYSRIKRCRSLVTMVVSAYWHGLYPGYFIGFVAMAVSISAEKIMLDVVGNLSGSWQKKFSWVFWAIRVHQLVFLSTAFILLRYEFVMRVMSSMYYIGLVLPVFQIVVGLTVKHILD